MRTLSNAFTSSRMGRGMLAKLGLVELPALDTIDLRAELAARGVREASVQALAGLSDAERARSVIVVQDAFTSYYDAAVVLDFVELIGRLGFSAMDRAVQAQRQAAARSGVPRRLRANGAHERHDSQLSLRAPGCPLSASTPR
jgi:hypothetical protein